MTVDLHRDIYTPHRNYVAHNANFDTGLTVFQVLLEQGLKSTDVLCDVGCGSLRVGRHLITYLEHGCYYAIEPNQWLLDAAIENEVGTQPIVKRAHFVNRDDFDISLAYPDTLFDWVLISSVFPHASHNQLRQALESATGVAKKVLFDTVPGPDHTSDYWQYPQIANHNDDCVELAAFELGTLTKLHLGTFGEQWWLLNAGI